MPQPRLLRVGQRANAVAFSPDGNQLATGGPGQVRIWNLQTGALVRKLRTGRLDTVNAVAFSPDGTRLATGSNGSAARIWDATTGRQQFQLTNDGWVSAVAFSPDGTRLATGSSDTTARIWDATTGQQQLQVTHAAAPQASSDILGLGASSGGIVAAVAFSPDGTRLATGSSDTTARIWDITGR